MSHPSVPAVEAVARGAASLELVEEVGCGASEPIAEASREVLTLLGLGASAERGIFQAKAIFTLARQCIVLADVPGAEDIACGLSVAVAELIANSVAAFALSLDVLGQRADAGPLEMLELLSLELDRLAPALLAALSRLDFAPCYEAPEEVRLLRALRGVCCWAFAALGRAVGYDQISGRVLWEWASGDATWALLLVKGAIAMAPDDPGDGEVAVVAVPGDLAELKRSALEAALGLAAPDVIFGGETDDVTGEAISIHMRSAEQTLHRAELAVGASSIDGFIDMLVEEAWTVGGGIGPKLASFLVGVLQPELAGQPDWATMSPVMEATMREAQRAAAILASRFEPRAPAVWRLLAAAPKALGGQLPAGFLQDCANLAYMSSPPEEDMHSFVGDCLASTTRSGDAAASDAGALASLCVLAANSGVRPDEGGALASAVSAALSASPHMLEDLHRRWERWRGPPLGMAMGRWREFAEALVGTALPPEPPRPVAAEVAPPMPPPQRPQHGAALSALLRDAPEHYRCQLDRRLMMDPVRTPHGYIVDRSGLTAALASQAGVCPLSGQPLAVESCERLPALRKEIQVWVREQRGSAAGRARPQLAGAVA